MKNIQIIVGSEMGGTEHIANFLATQLGSTYSVRVNTSPEAAHITRDEKEFLLFMTANTGAGDLPANISPLFDELKTLKPHLKGRKYALVNFGDSSYPTFGEAGQRLDEALMENGAVPVAQSLIIDACIDRYPQQLVLQWLRQSVLDA